MNIAYKSLPYFVSIGLDSRTILNDSGMAGFPYGWYLGSQR